MIDIENKVFNDIAVPLREQFKGIYVVGEFIDLPNSFPCVTLVEEDNFTYTGSQDTSLQENHANIVYTVNIYSNKAKGKKTEAKAIADVIDNLMQDMKFTRTFRSQIPNTDRTIYRIIMRYSAIVSKGKTDGDSTVYQVYRK